MIGKIFIEGERLSGERITRGRVLWNRHTPVRQGRKACSAIAELSEKNLPLRIMVRFSMLDAEYVNRSTSEHFTMREGIPFSEYYAYRLCRMGVEEINLEKALKPAQVKEMLDILCDNYPWQAERILKKMDIEVFINEPVVRGF